jgi:hypothetical protein
MHRKGVKPAKMAHVGLILRVLGASAVKKALAGRGRMHYTLRDAFRA